MKFKKLFFIMLFLLVIILFGGMYFLGIMNLFAKNSVFFEKFKWLDFGAPIISIFYLIVLTIFFIVVVAIMSRLVMSLRNENSALTATNIDDFSIKSDVSTKNFSEGDYRAEPEEKDERANDSRAEDNQIFEEKMDSAFQNFSQMINDIIQSASVAELFEKILFWGASLSNSKRGSIMVIDKNKELYIYKTIGWSAEEKHKIKDIKTPVGEGISGKVALENKRIFVTNIETCEGFDFKYKEKYESKSFISLPVYGLHRVVAVLNLTDNKRSYYSISELEALNIITKLSAKVFELIQLKKK
ncbi:MAG TPA: GAF domain-containing protein [Spirochaetota bacterium]|nr:GAF domain-containing protein [Spirochaetota bacterium]